MRDPDLVQRAERAATTLEQAWVRWREQHGLGTGPLPPVSSYVGYSLEEPWGQPRVVLGVEASEAERLAAILEGHDCVGPVHAGVTSRPDRALQAAAPGSRPGVPSQQSRLAPALATLAQYGYSQPVAAAPLAAAPVAAAPVAVQPAPAGPEATGLDQAASGQPSAASAQADLAPRDENASDPAGEAAEDLTAEQPIMPLAIREAAAVADQPAELPADEAAQLRKLTARPPAGAPLSRAFPPAPILPASGRGKAVAVTQAAGLPAAGQPDDDQLTKARLLPVSRLSRPRRSAQEGREDGAWPAAGDQQSPATDTAV